MAYGAREKHVGANLWTSSSSGYTNHQIIPFMGNLVTPWKRDPNQILLVVEPPLWKIWVSWDDEIPNIWTKKMFQTTNQRYTMLLKGVGEHLNASWAYIQKADSICWWSNLDIFIISHISISAGVWIPIFTKHSPSFLPSLGLLQIFSRFSTWNHDQSMIQDHTQWLGRKITGNHSIINGKKNMVFG